MNWRVHYRKYLESVLPVQDTAENLDLEIRSRGNGVAFEAKARIYD